MNEENIQRFIDNYLDRETWVFTYTSKLMPKYIYLRDIVSIGPIEAGPEYDPWNKHENRCIFVDMFVRGGGLMRVIIYYMPLAEIKEHDREYHEALIRSWKECKRNENAKS